jgi:hypothetical protein
MGASVNSLTASDYGWDLHLHVPEEEMYFSPTAPPEDSWVLSGRTAHVQVKRRSGSSSWPSLATETVRGWLTGTSTGTPTFVFIVDDTDPKVTKFRFSTPRELDLWLDHYESMSSGTLGNKWTLPYKRHVFPRLLQLWVRYPHVMNNALIKPYLETNVITPEDAFFKIAREIATGYCVHQNFHFRDDPTIKEGDLLDAFVEKYAEYDSGAAQRVRLDLQFTLRDRANLSDPDQNIVSGGVPLAAYTQHVNPDDSLAAAVDCSNWVAGIYP